MDEILVIDFKSSFTDNVLECLDKLKMRRLLVHEGITLETVKRIKPMGIILTGSHDHVYEDKHLECHKEILELGIPVLGICYGHQLVHHLFGGEVKMIDGEEGSIKTYLEDSLLFKDMAKVINTGMYHHDSVTRMAIGFRKIAHTDLCEYAGSENIDKRIYTVQFHPESSYSEDGIKVLKNFIEICQQYKNS